MTESVLRKYVRKYIRKGFKEFIIYPFGSNGLMIQQILKECFGITPRYIVDVEYSQYRDEIITLQELKKVYEPEMFVLLVMEDQLMNEGMKANLQTFVPECNIGNLLDEVGQKKDFFVSSFLPQDNYFVKAGFDYINTMEKSKIKIRITHQLKEFFNTISTLCRACELDDEIDLLMVITKNTIGQMEELGYMYVLENEYDIEQDKPDILIIYSETYIQNHLEKVRKSTGLISVLWPVLIQYGSFYLNNRAREFYELCEPDYYLVDSYLYKSNVNTWFSNGGQLLECGNPKYDGIYEATQKKEIYLEQNKWKKLKNKKVILWAPTHGVYELENYSNCVRVLSGTFDLYAKTIIEYVTQNKELALIFRPHPKFIEEMLHTRIWSQEDYQYLKKYFEESDNIVLDEANTYDAAYSVSDAVITDVGCGIVASALPMLKPVCVLYRAADQEDADYAINKNYYRVFSNEELTEFMNMIKNGCDDKLEIRKKMAEDFVMHFDGQNGRRLKDLLKEKYKSKCRRNEEN